MLNLEEYSLKGKEYRNTRIKEKGRRRRRVRGGGRGGGVGGEGEGVKILCMRCCYLCIYPFQEQAFVLFCCCFVKPQPLSLPVDAV